MISPSTGTQLVAIKIHVTQHRVLLQTNLDRRHPSHRWGRAATQRPDGDVSEWRGWEARTTGPPCRDCGGTRRYSLTQPHHSLTPSGYTGLKLSQRRCSSSVMWRPDTREQKNVYMFVLKIKTDLWDTMKSNLNMLFFIWMINYLSDYCADAKVYIGGI